MLMTKLPRIGDPDAAEQCPGLLVGSMDGTSLRDPDAYKKLPGLIVGSPGPRLGDSGLDGLFPWLEKPGPGQRLGQPHNEDT